MKTINNIDIEQWNKLSRQSIVSNFFQSKECYDFYRSLSFLEEFCFGVEDNGLLKGVIIGYIQKEVGKVKQFLSKRAIIIGGPLLADDISEEALEQLLLYTRKKLSNKVIYIETRNFNDYSRYKDVFKKCGFDYVEHLNFHVDCNNELQMTKNMSSSKVRQVKKSLKSGVEIIEARSDNDIIEFYNLLKVLYKTKVKTPLMPLEFFMNFYKMNIGKYLLVKYNSEIIGGIMCPVFDNNVIYEWFVVGKDYGEYKNLYPSIVATWSAMDYAVKNNILRFDLMGAGKPDEGYGVRDFKAKFGGVLVEHGRFLCVTKPILYQIGKFGVKILKKIK